jgi:two-component system, LytTR family, sensor kinase
VFGLYKNKWIRWVSFILLAIAFRFLLDVVYSLIYRQYPLFQPFRVYLYAILLVGLVFESIYQVNRIYNRKFKWSDNPHKRFFIQWLTCLGIGFFFIEGIRWLVAIMFMEVNYVRLLDEVIIMVFVLIVSTTLVLIDLSMFLLEKWRFSLAELERFKKENAEFRFESLRSQLNPHFLFNSLNTLASLIYENGEKAELFIRELADVYRYILEFRDHELVKVSKELEMVRSYIYLVQLRFDQNLEMTVNIGTQSGERLIAPMTMQMLIENAIKHNIISKKKPLTIRIYDEENYLVVENNLQKKETKEYSSNVGLKNIQSRYNFLSANKMEVYEDKQTFKVRIPLI